MNDDKTISGELGIQRGLGRPSEIPSSDGDSATETPIYLAVISTLNGRPGPVRGAPNPARPPIDLRNQCRGESDMTHATQNDRVTPDHVEINLKMAYLKTRRDHHSRVLEGFVTLLEHFQRNHMALDALMQETADLIRSLFTLRYVMIGLKGQDGMYKYEFMSGMRDDSWAAHRKKVYTLESFATSVPGWYSVGVISKLSRVYLEEKNPLGPGYENSVNRPALLSQERSSIDSSLEADFFNTLINGPRDQLLGWIEYPGTLVGKLPDATVIRNVEVIASILGAAITFQDRKKRTP